jgi:cytochrome subunit of sulfide dehydrogenase
VRNFGNQPGKMIPIAVAVTVLFLNEAAAGADAPPGAASCSGCHPASRSIATTVPHLNNRDAAQIIAAMREFRTGHRPATVMDRIAKGFTDDDIKAIAAWYAAQQD